MQIHFYGRIGERLGGTIALALPSTAKTIGDLRRTLCEAYPDAAAEIRSSALKACVNDEIVGESYVIQGAENVEFLPTVSGG